MDFTDLKVPAVEQKRIAAEDGAFPSLPLDLTLLGCVSNLCFTRLLRAS